TGTKVTINGIGFADATDVQFGQVSTNFQIIDDTQITTNCPANAITAPISIITPEGTATSTDPFVVKTNEDFVLVSNVTSRSLDPGKSGLFIIKANPIGSFNGPVGLSVKGLPPEITANFSPTVVTPGVISQLLLVASSSYVPGSYTFNVVGD